MTWERPAYALALAALVALGFFWLPGHTYLQSDTQIYIPILERFRDPSLYPHDPVAQRHHVTYTIYDEAALALRWLTGAESFQPVLTAQQLATRYCGALGAFLTGRAFGLAGPQALLVAAIYSLGASVMGPAVLTIEYEPVPRGFAFGLLVLATGLAAQGWRRGAAVAAGLAILYHPPTALPFLVGFAVILWRERDARPAWILSGFVAALFAFSRFQIGAAERHDLFATISPEMEPVLRLRGSYVWVSLWAQRWLPHYLFLWVFSAAAWWRWRKEPAAPRILLAVHATFGLVSMGVSLGLLEGLRWQLTTALQPARAAAFLTLAAILWSACGGLLAASRGRWWEGALWLMPGFAAILSHDSLALLVPRLSDPVTLKRVVLMLAFALACAAAASKWRGSVPCAAAAAIAPFLLIPTWGEVRNYPQLDWAPVDELAAWARESTPKDAVFLFPDSAREPYPSIFRAKALRSVYVDWKGGGQVNLVRGFGEEWSRRWRLVNEQPLGPERFPALAAEGVKWLVTRDALPGYEPSWSNRRYFVYELRP